MVSDSFVIFSRHGFRRGPAQGNLNSFYDLSLMVEPPAVFADWPNFRKAKQG